MKKANARQLLLFIFLSFFSLSTFAWDNSIQVGYGYSHDPNHTKYDNSGLLVSADLYPLDFYFLKRTPWTYWSINGSFGQWHTTTPVNKSLTTAALSLAVRLYPVQGKEHFLPYLFGSAGPAYLSENKFGLNTQASHLSIQTNFGLGVEMLPVDINLRLEHFSNAGLGNPNEGFNILYLLSIGYLF